MQRLKDAKLIVSIFNTFVPNCACIVGGFLRDIELGREPKDIDILIEYNGEADYREVAILADRLGYSLRDHSANYAVDEVYSLRNVYTLTKDGCLNIDVIFINNTIAERIKEFPCGLSQIWLEGHWIKRTDKFNYGYRNKILQFTEDAPNEYVQRMQEYFPNYEVEFNAYTK